MNQQTLISINFKRFKNKSINLMFQFILDYDKIEDLDQFKYKKLFKVLLKINMSKHNIIQRPFTRHTNKVNCLLKFNNYILVSGSSDQSIKVWNILDGTCLNTIKCHSSEITCIIKLCNNSIASCSNQTD